MKIRIHINVILALLILVSNVGLAFNVHYCEGKLSGISFNYKVNEPCLEEKLTKKTSCCAIENNHSSCCTDEKVEIKKIDSENILIKNIQLDLATFIPLSEYSIFNSNSKLEIISIKETISFYCKTNAPPLYQLYSQYIFYA